MQYNYSKHSPTSLIVVAFHCCGIVPGDKCYEQQKYNIFDGRDNIFDGREVKGLSILHDKKSRFSVLKIATYITLQYKG